MDVKAVGSILNKFESVLGHKYSKRGVLGAALVFYMTFKTEIHNIGEGIGKFTWYKEQIELIATKEESFKIELVKLHSKIDSLENQIEFYQELNKKRYLIVGDRIDDLDERENEKDKILIEELDHIDTLGASFEMTNPGNIYRYIKGHFVRPFYDMKYKRWEIQYNNKNIIID